MKTDNTVTIHTTVRASTLYALERMAQKRNISLGKVIEMVLWTNEEFESHRREYFGKKSLENPTPPLF